MNTTTIDMEATGRNIARLRKQNRMTVRQLQQELGFNTPQAIYKWTRGDSLPTLDNLVILSVLFGVELSEIVAIRKDER